MKFKKVCLNELVSNTKGHTIRVRCSDKLRVREEPGKKKRRCLKLTDEQGTEINAMLFGSNVDLFDSIIEYGKDYDISNVLVRDVNPTFYKEGRNKQELIITDSTLVHQIHGASSSMVREPFCALGNLPKSVDTTTIVDVVVVVLHVEPPKQVSTYRVSNAQVCEIYVSDDSCDKIMLISAWFDLAATLYERLSDAASVNHIISFTVLRPSTYKGYSLGTTPSTHYQLEAMGNRANLLREWCEGNTEIIETRKLQAQSHQLAYVPPELIHIADALSKKAEDIPRGQQYKIKVHIEMFTPSEVKLSVGCRFCNRNCDVAAGETFTCASCSHESNGQPRLYLSVTVTDQSGSLQLSAFTHHVEKLLSIDASELHAKDTQGKKEFITSAASTLNKQTTELVIIPSLSLLMDHKKVKWILKDVLK